MTYTLTAEQMQQVREALVKMLRRTPFAEPEAQAALALLDAAMQAPEATGMDALEHAYDAGFEDGRASGARTDQRLAVIKDSLAALAAARTPEATAGGDVREVLDVPMAALEQVCYHFYEKEGLGAKLTPDEASMWKRCSDSLAGLNLFLTALAAAPKPCEHGCVDGWIQCAGGGCHHGPSKTCLRMDPCPKHAPPNQKQAQRVAAKVQDTIRQIVEGA